MKNNALLSLMETVMVLIVGIFVLSRDARVRLNHLFFRVMLALALWSAVGKRSRFCFTVPEAVARGEKP